MKHLSYEERLRDLRLFSLEKKRCRGISTVCIIKQGSKDGARLLSVVPSDKRRCNENQLKYRRFYLNIFKLFNYLNIT